uniref:Prefoldin subunit 3 n=1 Tax=Panagrolaimus sp. ES5 TaxID=591445 RepID=A0AC34FY46_9BILA
MNKNRIRKKQTDVEEYLKENKLSIEEAQKRVDTNYRKYKLVEQNLTAQKEKIEENEPEFAVGRELLAKMKEALEDPDYEWPMEITYPLAEQIFAKAHVDKFETLTIVLGNGSFADVTIDEADKMFTKNLNDINRLTTQLGEEINFIKDQVTTSEVNVAHLYNYNVILKKAAAGLEDKKP